MIKLIVGLAILIWGIVLTDKGKYPSNTTASKWSIPLIVIGSLVIFWTLFSRDVIRAIRGPQVGWKSTPGIFGK